MRKELLAFILAARRRRARQAAPTGPSAVTVSGSASSPAPCDGTYARAGSSWASSEGWVLSFSGGYATIAKAGASASFRILADTPDDIEGQSTWTLLLSGVESGGWQLTLNFQD